MKPILVVGDVAAEIALRGLSGHPRRGHEVFVSAAELSAGGDGARFAAALGRLGRDVTFVGKVGKDELGDLLLKRFKGQRISRDPRLKTGLRMSLRDDADASVITSPGATAGFTMADLRAVTFRRYGHLHVASPFQLLGLPLAPLVRKARAAGLTVSISAGNDPRGRGLADLAPDVLLTDDPKGPRGTLTVLRRGEKGAQAFTGSGRWKAAGRGAGPVFDAAFIDGWLGGHRVHEILAYAGAAASLAAEEGVTPTRAEALHYVGRLNERKERR